MYPLWYKSHQSTPTNLSIYIGQQQFNNSENIMSGTGYNTQNVLRQFLDAVQNVSSARSRENDLIDRGPERFTSPRRSDFLKGHRVP